MSDEEKAIQVGRCRREDLPEIKKILEDAAEAAMWSEEVLAGALSGAPDFLVARRGADIAGFIIGRGMGEEAEILNLAVPESFRRLGVGKALVKALLESYKGRGAKKIFLEVRESNRGAIVFYEHLGFREVGKRVGYYRDPVETALVLAREE